MTANTHQAPASPPSLNRLRLATMVARWVFALLAFWYPLTTVAQLSDIGIIKDVVRGVNPHDGTMSTLLAISLVINFVLFKAYDKRFTEAITTTRHTSAAASATAAACNRMMNWMEDERNEDTPLRHREAIEALKARIDHLEKEKGHR